MHLKGARDVVVRDADLADRIAARDGEIDRASITTDLGRSAIETHARGVNRESMR